MANICKPGYRRLLTLSISFGNCGTNGLPEVWALHAEHILSSNRSQGETLALRLDGADMDGGDNQFGILAFDDGGMKGLAAVLNWIGLVYVAGKEQIEDLRHERVISLASSLLALPTFYKHQAGSAAQNMIQRIIKQNVDAKKLPVSSFEWSGILRSLKPKERINVADAIAMYNDSPEVHAHGGAAARSGIWQAFSL